MMVPVPMPVGAIPNLYFFLCLFNKCSIFGMNSYLSGKELVNSDVRLTPLPKNLEDGLECFRKRILASMESELEKTDEMASVVQDVFMRLHDGHILTISGECPHPVDIECAKQSTTLNAHGRNATRSAHQRIRESIGSTSTIHRDTNEFADSI
jgi:hypothetical protein